MKEYLLQRFIPERYRDNVDTHRAAAFVVAMSWLAAVFAVFYALVSSLIRFWPGVLIMSGSALIYVVIPPLLRRGLGLTATAHVLVAIGFGGTVGCAYYSGGFESPVTPWIAAVVLTALLLGGRRVGLQWAAVGVLTITALWMLWVADIPAPRVYDPRFHDGFSFACYAGLVLILYSLGMEFQREKERALERLASKNVELEITLKELKSAQIRLIHAEKMASLGRVIAGVAHEIKNPLNFINNFANLSVGLVDEMEQALGDARQLSDDEPVLLLKDIRNNISRIEEHGRRADAIVRGMMDHVQGGSGERVLLDVNSLVDSCVRLAEHGIQVRQPGFEIQINRDYDPSAGQVEAVPQEIDRVLLNLLNNAFYSVGERRSEHGEAYEPTVTMRTQRRNHTVEIHVVDNGIGVPEEIRPKIFEPFFTTKPAGQGTGLGLSLSHEIVVEGHDGSLEFRAEEGGGACFIVALPAAMKTVLSEEA